MVKKFSLSCSGYGNLASAMLIFNQSDIAAAPTAPSLPVSNLEAANDYFILNGQLSFRAQPNPRMMTVISELPQVQYVTIANDGAVTTNPAGIVDSAQFSVWIAGITYGLTIRNDAQVQYNVAPLENPLVATSFMSAFGEFETPAPTGKVNTAEGQGTQTAIPLAPTANQASAAQSAANAINST